MGSRYTINTKSLDYQKALWPTPVKLVKMADKYNVKLTLAFNPQWAEYILQESNKVEIVKQWINNGHEIAFHHHGINHVDWNGYTNRSIRKTTQKNKKFSQRFISSSYRGTAKDGFNWLEKLAFSINVSYKIITGCITDTATDKPEEIVILTKGSREFPADFMSKPFSTIIPDGQELFWINHYQLPSNFNTRRNPNLFSEEENLTKTKKILNKIKDEYKNANRDQVVGIVFHNFDFYRFPEIYENLFEFIYLQHKEVKTIRKVIKEYIDKFNI